MRIIKKTAIYQIQHSHNRDIPLEELLRQLADTVEQGQAAAPEHTRPSIQHRNP
ncbi:hypothetical protein OO184_24235 [Photorhabdus sp. APURE]|uniref:VasL domain-containing protein n=1 Tax=Photorhabdus aballayi TaxID=2991723 RepID=UPI00223E7C1B|nr:VasL domain-containing protein [Photorhabdus aballayi]MCW7550949.1 hypothetical protein [Photorhabdus aballayi]